jgi:hypothetical protein
VTAPREFSDWVRSAEFHALQLERSLALAADKAPSEELGSFVGDRALNAQQIRKILPSVRHHARRA